MGRNSAGVRLRRALIVVLMLAGGLAVSEMPVQADVITRPALPPPLSQLPPGGVVSGAAAVVLSPPRQVCGQSGNGEVILTWMALPDANRVGFVVEHRPQGNGAWTSVNVGDQFRATVASTNGQPREFRVAARDSSGNRSEWGTYCLLTWSGSTENPVPQQAAMSWPHSEGRAIAEFTPMCLVDDVGRVRCLDGYSQFITETTMTNVESSFPTWSHWNFDGTHCGLRLAGVVTCWGRTGQIHVGPHYTPTDVGGVLSGETVTALSLGGSHACAVTSDGRVACWGSNSSGQLGMNPATTSSTVPVWVDSGVLSNAVAVTVSAGSAHTCVITTSGAVACWGSNHSQELGRGTSSSWELPGYANAGALAATSLSALASGGGFSCGVSVQATAICWGANSSGQLGQGTAASVNDPVVVQGGALGGAAVAAIDTGSAHACAIVNTGGLWCWGDNSLRQVNNSATSNEPTPTEVTGGVIATETVTAIHLRSARSCALVRGRVACWGQGKSGAASSGTPAWEFGAEVDFLTISKVAHGRPFYSSAPQCFIVINGSAFCLGTSGLVAVQRGVLAGEGVTDIAVGSDHTCAITVGGRVACWGDGYGSNPVWVSGGALANVSVSSLSVGHAHTCAATTGGLVACWGSNTSGQIGDGTLATSRAEPVAVNGGALTGVTVSSLSAGGNHTCAVTQHQTVVCWGENWSGQVGGGVGTQRRPVRVTSGALFDILVQSVHAGDAHSCAVTVLERVICWGFAGQGQTGNDRNWSYQGPAFAVGGDLAGQTITSMWTAGSYNCAVTTAARTICWGLQNYGDSQSVVPRTIDQARLWKGTVTEVSGVTSPVATWGGILAAGDPPTAPTAVGAYPDGRTITATWDTPAWSGAAPITGYIVEASSDLGVTWPVSTTVGPVQQATFTVPRDDYWITRVTALNGAAASQPSRSADEILVRTETRVVRSNVAVTFRTAAGTPVRGAHVGWSTTDGVLSSVNTVVTSNTGVATFPALATGPVGFSLSGATVDNSGAALSSSTLTTVIALEGTIPVMVVPNPPAVIQRVVTVKMPNHHPVADATLSISGGVGQYATTGQASNARSYGANWVYSQWAGNYWSNAITTNASGMATVAGFALPTTGSDITATYSDGTLQQQTSGPLTLPELTLVFEQMPFVTALSGSTITAQEGQAITINAEATDGNGSPLTGATLQLASVNIQPQAVSLAAAELGTMTTCTPQLTAVTGANGRATLRLCASTTGTWRVTGANLVPSRPVAIHVTALPNPGTNDPGSGGGSGGGGGGSAPPPPPSSGGSGGGGGGLVAPPASPTSSGSSGEPVTARLSPPVSRATPTVVGLVVPGGRVELRLTGLTRAAEVSVAVIEAPVARGITLLPTAFDISVTTAGGLDRAELCVPVDAGELAAAGVDARRLSLFHFDPDPVDVTTRSSATEVCGVTTSFSPFAVGVPATSRLAGANRYDTAAQLVAQAFPNTAALVLVATGANFPDALAASAAAANADAPLLLVTSNSIPAATRTQLLRLRPQRIVIVGGVSAVGSLVEAELGRLATVERIAGTNRYDTAARLATRFFDPAATSGAYLVNGDNFPDALAAGAASSYTKRPVLLTQTRSLPGVTSDALERLGIGAVTIVGGENAVASQVAQRVRTLVGTVTRVAGTNRYDTATQLATTITNAGRNVLIATGVNFPDALGAAAVAARLNATLVLTTSSMVPAQTTSYLTRRPPTAITILGGTNAISRSTETQLATTHLR